jgi:RHS repeat-associated protein
VWDGQNVLRKESSAPGVGNDIIRTTDYPGYWGGLASLFDSIGGSQILAFDPQGNVRLVLQGGSVAGMGAYTGFGEVLSDPGVPFAYVGLFGYQWDNPFYYVRARYYDPVTGRWYSRDPLGFRASGANLYGYVRNSGVSQLDPSGLKCLCGPEIGTALRNVVRATQLYFHKQGWFTKNRLCSALAVVPDVYTAWNIVQLSPTFPSYLQRYRGTGCATPNSPCEDTVRVDGQCHLAWAVDYIIFGAMNRLCYDYNTSSIRIGPYTIDTSLLANAPWDLDAVKMDVYAFKYIAAAVDWATGIGGHRYRLWHAGPAVQWAAIGWNAGATFTAPPSDPARQSCGDCGVQEAGSFQAIWRVPRLFNPFASDQATIDVGSWQTAALK